MRWGLVKDWSSEAWSSSQPMEAFGGRAGVYPGEDRALLKSISSVSPGERKHIILWNMLVSDECSRIRHASVDYRSTHSAAATAIDISKHEEEPKIVWQWDEVLPDAASPLGNKDYLILPTAYGVVTCLNAKTGEVHWEHEFDKGFVPARESAAEVRSRSAGFSLRS